MSSVVAQGPVSVAAPIIAVANPESSIAGQRLPSLALSATTSSPVQRASSLSKPNVTRILSVARSRRQSVAVPSDGNDSSGGSSSSSASSPVPHTLSSGSSSSSSAALALHEGHDSCLADAWALLTHPDKISDIRALDTLRASLGITVAADLSDCDPAIVAALAQHLRPVPRVSFLRVLSEARHSAGLLVAGALVNAPSSTPAAAVHDAWLQLQTIAQHSDPEAMARLLFDWGLTDASHVCMCTADQVAEAASLFKPVAQAQFVATMTAVLNSKP
jgi:hypothetical protein